MGTCGSKQSYLDAGLEQPPSRAAHARQQTERLPSALDRHPDCAALEIEGQIRVDSDGLHASVSKGSEHPVGSCTGGRTWQVWLVTSHSRPLSHQSAAPSQPFGSTRQAPPMTECCEQPTTLSEGKRSHTAATGA